MTSARLNHRFQLAWTQLFLSLMFILMSGVVAQELVTPSNSPRWRSMGGMPGTTHPSAVSIGSPVYCSEIGPDGHLYVAGQFTVCGDVVSHGVAKWDGSKWISISSSDSDSYDVRSMTFDAQGDLIVGGRFRRFGGKDILRIARWDGTEWHAIGDGLGFDGVASSQTVSALAVSPSGELYAAGRFDRSGITTINNIARWDGNAWQPLGDGLVDSGVDVNDMVFDDSGNLYVTGSFGWAGGVQVNHVAKWDGVSWTGMGDGLFGPTGRVGHALMIDDSGDLIVGGSFRYAGNVSTRVNNIAKWNGTAWSAFGPAGDDAGFEAGTGIKKLFKTPGGDLVAASRLSIVDGNILYDLMRWNGTNWVDDVLPEPAVYGEVYTVTYLQNGDMVLGGKFNAFGVGANATHASSLIRWDGANFHRFGTGPDGIIRVIVFDDNDHMIVGGDFNTIGGIQASGIARFDGNQWWPYGQGVHGGSNVGVHSIALGANGALFAGGKFENAGAVASESIAYWDGSQWVSMDGGLEHTSTQPNVRAMVIGLDGSLFAAGIFDSSVTTNTPLSGIGRWHSGSWHDLDGGATTNDGTPRNSDLYGLALMSNGDVIAVGYFERMGTTNSSTRHIARWNGSAWSPVGTTNALQRPYQDTGIRLLGIGPGEQIYIGQNGNSTYRCVHRLQSNGQWQWLNGFNGSPTTFAFMPDGKVFVGGNLSNTNPNTVWNLLRGVGVWDGSVWQSLGNEGLGMWSTHDDVYASAQDGRGNLIFGGDFAGSADGVVSPFLIRTRTDDYGLWPVLGDLPLDQLDPADTNGTTSLTNLMAYAMGINPLNATDDDLPTFRLETEPSAGAEGEKSGDQRVIKYRFRRSRTASGIITDVMSSANLTQWNPANIIQTEILEQQADWEMVEVTVPADAASQFLRLSVEFDDTFYE